MSGYFGGYAEYGESLARREFEVAGELAQGIVTNGIPLIVHTMHARSAAAARLRVSRVPVYRTVEAAIGALSRLAYRSLQPPDGVPSLPPPAAPLAEAGYWQARELFAGAGVTFIPARRVRTLAEARDAAAELGYPLALKALGLEHKSDHGGVVLGLDGDDALRRAFVEMEARLSPPGFSLELMARLADGVELLIGCRRDARFGAIAVAGMGGIYTEILADVAVGLAPLDEAQALRMLCSLRGARLLGAVRGRAAIDVAAAANVLVALSHLAVAHPEIDELEINPLLALPEGVVALDARLVLR
jgi:acyl-CoA synthetase (NDP forming)